LSFSVVDLDAEASKDTASPLDSQQPLIADEPLAPSHQPHFYNTTATTIYHDPIMIHKAAIMNNPVDMSNSIDELSLMEQGSVESESVGDVILDDWPELELSDVDFDLMGQCEEPLAAVPFEQLVTCY